MLRPCRTEAASAISDGSLESGGIDREYFHHVLKWRFGCDGSGLMDSCWPCRGASRQADPRPTPARTPTSTSSSPTAMRAATQPSRPTLGFATAATHEISGPRHSTDACEDADGASLTSNRPPLEPIQVRTTLRP